MEKNIEKIDRAVIAISDNEEFVLVLEKINPNK